MEHRGVAQQELQQASHASHHYHKEHKKNNYACILVSMGDNKTMEKTKWHA